MLVQLESFSEFIELNLENNNNNINTIYFRLVHVLFRTSNIPVDCWYYYCTEKGDPSGTRACVPWQRGAKNRLIINLREFKLSEQLFN